MVDADVHALAIGDAVTLRFLPTQDGPPVPGFTTVHAELARAYSAQALRALNTPSSPQIDALTQVAVIGSGHMGVGISLAFLQAGLEVQLVDQTDAALDAAMERIRDTLEHERGKGRIDEQVRDERLARLRVSTDLASVASAGLIVEAIWEDMAAKRDLFARLDGLARPDAILATNTSTLDVTEIARATRRPGAVVGLHFFNPAQVMRLIEIVRTPLTDAPHAAGRASPGGPHRQDRHRRGRVRRLCRQPADDRARTPGRPTAAGRLAARTGGPLPAGVRPAHGHLRTAGHGRRHRPDSTAPANAGANATG